MRNYALFFSLFVITIKTCKPFPDNENLENLVKRVLEENKVLKERHDTLQDRFEKLQDRFTMLEETCLLVSKSARGEQQFESEFLSTDHDQPDKSELIEERDTVETITVPKPSIKRGIISSGSPVGQEHLRKRKV